MSQRFQKATPDIIISHWCKLIENFQHSSLAFYERLHAALHKREIPRLEHGPVWWREGGTLSPKRQYMRIIRERLVVDICAAPFGTGFFVSWRLGEIRLRLNISVAVDRPAIAVVD